MAKIKIKPHEGFRQEWMPQRGTAGAAAWDVFAAEDVMLQAFQPKLVPTKLDIEIPEGHALFVLPRSGNSLKKGLLIPNSPGLIDEDYRGHLQVIMTFIPTLGQLQNQLEATPWCMVKNGDKIAQVMLVKYETQEWEVANELSETGRGRGGFGSTDSGSKA